MGQEFGLWVGPAVLRIHVSGDASPKELSLAAESLEGSTRTSGSGPSGSELGDTELHRNSPVVSWWSVSTLNLKLFRALERILQATVQPGHNT